MNRILGSRSISSTISSCIMPAARSCCKQARTVSFSCGPNARAEHRGEAGARQADARNGCQFANGGHHGFSPGRQSIGTATPWCPLCLALHYAAASQARLRSVSLQTKNQKAQSRVLLFILLVSFSPCAFMKSASLVSELLARRAAHSA
jgi:hypothetical protein